MGLYSRKQALTLYTGSARNIVKRVHEHREALLPGFTRKYGVSRLVWFEGHDGVAAAQKREQQIKRWRRAWKIALIEEQNLHWQDLYPALAGFSPAPLALPAPDQNPGVRSTR